MIATTVTAIQTLYSTLPSTGIVVQAAGHHRRDSERVDLHLVVDVPNIKQPKDCGVFAIAYAYHASLGDDLSMFDQKMKQHLQICF